VSSEGDDHETTNLTISRQTAIEILNQQKEAYQTTQDYLFKIIRSLLVVTTILITVITTALTNRESLPEPELNLGALSSSETLILLSGVIFGFVILVTLSITVANLLLDFITGVEAPNLKPAYGSSVDDVEIVESISSDIEAQNLKKWIEYNSEQLGGSVERLSRMYSSVRFSVFAVMFLSAIGLLFYVGQVQEAGIVIGGTLLLIGGVFIESVIELRGRFNKIKRVLARKSRNHETKREFVWFLVGAVICLIGLFVLSQAI
jgi:hypothetical protein